jgi:hypothetical protein
MFRIHMSCMAMTGAVRGVSSALARADINIIDISFITRTRTRWFRERHWGEGYVVVEDKDARSAWRAIQILKGALPVGIRARDLYGTFILEIYLENRPRALERVLKKLAENNIGIYSIQTVGPSHPGRNPVMIGFFNNADYLRGIDLLREWSVP